MVYLASADTAAANEVKAAEPRTAEAAEKVATESSAAPRTDRHALSVETRCEGSACAFCGRAHAQTQPRDVIFLTDVSRRPSGLGPAVLIA
jgi:hypothetical protein